MYVHPSLCVPNSILTAGQIWLKLSQMISQHNVDEMILKEGIFHVATYYRVMGPFVILATWLLCFKLHR